MKKRGVFSMFHRYLLIFALLPMAGGVYAMGKSEPTLYDRLGGVYNIATVVDDFIERLYVNDTLNANPKIKDARDRVSKAGLKYQVTSFICKGIGGPQNYTGRTMKESHKDLDITQKEWDAMAGDFKITLDKFNVPEKEQKELFDIVGSLKEDILMPAQRSGEPLRMPMSPRGAGY